MKHFLTAAAAMSLLVSAAAPAMAQHRDDHHDNRNDHHANYRDHGWHKGGRIDRSDWNRGRRVSDWRNHRLNAPPRGYEWREVDGNYVLAAAATGLIASIILASH